MKIKYRGNKMSAKICEINNFEYLQKLIYTEITLKIFTPSDSLHQLYPIIQK